MRALVVLTLFGCGSDPAAVGDATSCADAAVCVHAVDGTACGAGDVENVSVVF